MKLDLFDYDLPKEMIATEPASPRDAAKLFVYDRMNKKSVHTRFSNIGTFLKRGDVLILNNTKVTPARLIGKLKHPDGMLGRKFKILLLEKKNKNSWTALVDGKGRQAGLVIVFGKNFQAEIVKRIGSGIWEINFNKGGINLDNFIAKFGQMPLPPYIKQGGYKKQNKDWYQTIYAKYSGSIAAPTAGLHFTKKLIAGLKKQGIKIEYITLHVGLGTFLPVKTEKIEQHKMHKELAIISPKTAKRLNAAKKSGKKIIVCGTTAARTLESFAKNGKILSGKKYTDIFIYPPYQFKIINALITNFHLPKSTLMMMVAAFLSEGNTRGIRILKELYQEAIKKKYRFYSYGDVMLIK